MRSTVTLALITVVLAGCSITRGSGNVVSEPRAVEGFDSIESSGSVTVQVAVGGVHGVAVQGEDNIVNLIRTRLVGTTLVIDTELGRGYSATKPLTVMVSIPMLRSVEVSGSSGVTAVGVDGELLDLQVSGSGSIEVAGAISSLTVDVSGSGSVTAKELDAGQAEVDVSGSGSVVVSARDNLTIDVSGSGNVQYFGEPSMQTNVSGSGSVSKAG